jgi:UDP-2,3-diacylglucosamine pyrophosphatase LpxH
MGIIAVSDVHLGYMENKTELAETKNFIGFLKELAKRDDITDFVICGDLLDMWRRDMAGVVIENLHILKMIQDLQPKKDPDLQPKIKVHYLAGNHDYHICHLTKYYYPFDFKKGIDPKKGFTLPEGGKTYRFKHGYDIEPLMLGSECFFDILSSTSDEAGDFKSWLYDIISKIEAVRRVDIQTILPYIFDGAAIKAIESLFRPKPCNSSGGKEQDTPNTKLLSALLKPFEERRQMPGNKLNMDDYFKKSLKENEPLVFGHTHKPFHYEKDNKKAINLGSWINYNDRDHSTYLEIKDSQERLLVYPSGKEIPKTDVLPL